jgi:hypothetical protein
MRALASAVIFAVASIAAPAALPQAPEAGPAPVPDRLLIRFDNWLYFQENVNGSERWQYRPRFYIPFRLPERWTFTQRADFPVCYTDNTGSGNPTGDERGEHRLAAGGIRPK